MTELSKAPVVGRTVRRLHAAIDDRIDRKVGARVEERLGELSGQIEQLRHEVFELSERILHLEWDFRSMTPQLAALETRLADQEFERRLNDANYTPEQRIALTAIEVEHRRISARLQALGRFEERLRRLEQPDVPDRDGA